jgi:hypothetical protein
MQEDDGAFDQVALALDPVTSQAMSSSRSFGHMIAFSTLIALIATSLQASADTVAESECLAAANKQYKMQSVELSKTLGQRPSLETIEDILVRRRLEEAYCSRFVKCIEPSRARSGPRFSRCLDLEAEERLRHVTK